MCLYVILSMYIYIYHCGIIISFINYTCRLGVFAFNTLSKATRLVGCRALQKQI